jgi:hypothetical protein
MFVKITIVKMIAILFISASLRLNEMAAKEDVIREWIIL